MDLGATVIAGGVSFRVWAPAHRRVDVLVDGGAHRLAAEDNGYFALDVRGVRAGARYRFRLDGKAACPDPCSRFQPDGPHGESEVIDPHAYEWRDGAWRGVRLAGQVLYELHVGAFTREGTWRAAARELPALRALGVTMIELMPIAEFAGRFGWGYDGVDLYAPYHHYGRPDELRAFVDAAHAEGLGVLLDVVYNHLGPDGNYLGDFTPRYFTDRYENDWGRAINFDDDAAPVRAFFVQNACYWLREFHLDGLRLDATQAICDASPTHILAELNDAARRAARWPIVLIAENEPQQVRLVRPRAERGYGLDAIWNDDFHHAAIVALTGRREGYYHDYLGRAQELVSAVKRGFLFQGQRSDWQRHGRGSRVTDERGPTFVCCIENHDQLANSLRGEHLHHTAAPGCLRAMTALLLLTPSTPLLFMGQELGAPIPFLYFADHVPELSRRILAGRRDFLRQFKSYATAEAQADILDPSDSAVFERCKLDRAQARPELVELHRSLLELRRRDPVIAAQRRDRVDGAVFDDHALVLRFFDEPHGDRLLLVNLGAERSLVPAPEPLLGPPDRGAWTVAWSSDEPRFGGPGAANPCEPEGWRLPGQSAVLLVPAPTSKEPS